MYLMDRLETSRKVWKNVLVFSSEAEAQGAGFQALYHDDLCHGMIYGKPKDAHGILWMPGVVFDEKAELVGAT